MAKKKQPIKRAKSAFVSAENLIEFVYDHTEINESNPPKSVIKIRPHLNYGERGRWQRNRIIAEATQPGVDLQPSQWETLFLISYIKEWHGPAFEDSRGKIMTINEVTISMLDPEFPPIKEAMEYIYSVEYPDVDQSKQELEAQQYDLAPDDAESDDPKSGKKEKN